jgi:hypothetical protein
VPPITYKGSSFDSRPTSLMYVAFILGTPVAPAASKGSPGSYPKLGVPRRQRVVFRPNEEPTVGSLELINLPTNH